MLPNRATNDKIILSFHESLLRESDVKLLQGPHWLNDQIISFYFEYLEKIVYKNYEEQYLFVSPEVTQCIKIIAEDEISIFLSPHMASSKKFIFFALNDNEMANSAGGSHWSLLVLSRPDNKFYHFDSSGRVNYDQCKHLVERLKNPLLCQNAPLIQEECLQQNNGYDCGIHLICMADRICEHASRTGHVSGVRMLRSDIVKHKRDDVLRIIKDLGGTI